MTLVAWGDKGVPKGVMECAGGGWVEGQVAMQTSRERSAVTNTLLHPENARLRRHGTFDRWPYKTQRRRFWMKIVLISSPFSESLS